MKNLLLPILLGVAFAKSYGQYKPNLPSVSVTSTQLMSAYKQGTVLFSSLTYAMTPGGGNCASIAIIKTAIGTYGLYNVFRSVTVDEKNKLYAIVLRSGDTATLSFDRYKMAVEYFAYDKTRDKHDKRSKEILEYSKFCFAVMARVKQLRRRHFNEKFYYHAVDNLNKGEAAEAINELLGLAKTDIPNASSTNLNINKHTMVWNGIHAVYAFNGEYDEAFIGTGSNTGIEKLAVLETEHCEEEICKIEGAYTLD